MSTSGEAVLRDGRVVRLRAVPYEDPVARELVALVQAEYTARYGGPDAAEVDPGEFLPPVGEFLVAQVDGVPAGCGAWRVHRPGVVEVKRMYVDPEFRRLGLARLLLSALEAGAARAGHRAVVLNSGDRQPEALALYERAGYGPVPGYGVYADAPGAVFLGKELPEELSEEERSWAS
jgi:GNAT superfamily N-acetyltransferase